MESPIQEIERAFDGVPMPKELTLHVANAHDRYDYDDDAKHRAKDFVGRWQDVPEEHLKKCPMGLTHLGEDGIRFYLPAAMVWVLKNFRDSDSLLVDWTIYQLVSHRSGPALFQWFDTRFGLFNLEQCYACRSFLAFLLDQDPDGDHIDSKKALASLESWEKCLEKGRE